jgi:hypothetical protein
MASEHIGQKKKLLIFENDPSQLFTKIRPIGESFKLDCANILNIFLLKVII